jgi:hypothetical protein
MVPQPRIPWHEQLPITQQQPSVGADAVEQQVIAHLQPHGYLGNDQETSALRQADVDVVLAEPGG